MFDDHEQEYEENDYNENEDGEQEVDEVDEQGGEDEDDDDIIVGGGDDDDDEIGSIGEAEDDDDEVDDDDEYEQNEIVGGGNKHMVGGGDDDDDDSTNSSDDESSDDEEEYQYKLENDYKVKYIQTIHPEETSHEYEEIRNLSHVSRDEFNNVIKDEFHQTVPIMTKYEKTRILGLRVNQLNKGAKPFVKTTNAIIDNNIIAQQELKEKKLPFIIMRPIPNGKREYWKLEDLEYIEN